MSSLLADELLASGFLEAGTISLPEIVYGADGTGIYSCNWDSSGHLTITLTDGRVFVSPSLAGSDGFSPTVAVSNITGGHRVTITDITHPAGQSVDVLDGVSGERGPQGIDGADGVSPEVQVTAITGGHRITITDAAHPTGQSVDVMDGQSELYVVNILYKAVQPSSIFDPPTYRWEMSATADEIADAVTRGKKIVGHRITSSTGALTRNGYVECLFSGVGGIDPVSATFQEITSTGITSYTVYGGNNVARVETVPFSDGGISSLLVTFSESNGVWTADKTFAEVTAAIADGAYVHATDPLNFHYTVYECDPRPNDGAVTFIAAGDPIYGYVLDNDDTVYDFDYSFAKQTWVQNGYQPKSITDTGGYYTTDTVEGALQEIGAELAGINTLIGSGVIT